MGQRTIIITGANRGIGLALASVYARRGDSVHGVVRESSDTNRLDELGVEVHRADITSAESLESLRQNIGGAVDLLFNNAGIMAERGSIADIGADNLMDHYTINAVAPVLVTQAMLPLLVAAECAIVVNMSSSFASLELKSANMPQRYSYSMSKAALNMFTKTLAFEVADSGVAVVALHPGWTRTDLGGPNAELTPEESAAAMVETLDSLTSDQSGQFLSWTGRSLPW